METGFFICIDPLLDQFSTLPSEGGFASGAKPRVARDEASILIRTEYLDQLEFQSPTLHPQ